MHLHLINRNRDKQDKIAGSILWAGNAHWWLNNDYGRNTWEISGGWYFGKHARHTSIGVQTNFSFDHELSFNLGLWGLFYCYIAFACPLFPYWDYEHGDRVLDLRIFNWAIWINLWRNDDGYSTKDYWWKKPIVFHIDDFFLGKSKYSEIHLSEHYAEIPMPEANYPAKITFFESTWKRPRWPYPRKMVRSNVEMVSPIPVPGKGENSWDMDDDAIYSSTGPYSTVDAAIVGIQKSANRDREKYGGRDWLPEKEQE